MQTLVRAYRKHAGGRLVGPSRRKAEGALAAEVVADVAGVAEREHDAVVVVGQRSLWAGCWNLNERALPH